MLQTLKNAWSTKEIRSKILFTLLILLIYRVGTVIPVPFVEANDFASSLSGTILEYMNVLSGGSMGAMTLFALGVQPYINSSIIIHSLEFPYETGLILSCAAKVMKPFQTKQRIRPSCGDQEGRSGSDEVLLGTSVFPSSETGMSGNFWGRIKRSKYRFALQNGTLDFSWGAPAGMGLILE